MGKIPALCEEESNYHPGNSYFYLICVMPISDRDSISCASISSISFGSLLFLCSLPVHHPFDDLSSHSSFLLYETLSHSTGEEFMRQTKDIFRCIDPTVPCFRFLDISNGIFLGGRPTTQRQVFSGFRGCIANLTLDGLLIDFSDFSDMDKIGDVKEGCPQKRNFCSESLCPEAAKCVNRWEGHNCRCSHAVHGKTNCPMGQ